MYASKTVQEYNSVSRTRTWVGTRCWGAWSWTSTPSSSATTSGSTGWSWSTSTGARSRSPSPSQSRRSEWCSGIKIDSSNYEISIYFNISNIASKKNYFILDTQKCRLLKARLPRRFLNIYLWNGIVPSSRRTSLNFIIISLWQHVCRRVADSCIKKLCKNVRYTLANILVQKL